MSEDERSYKKIITLTQLSRHDFYSPASSSASTSASGEVCLTCVLFVTLSLLLNFLTSFAISAVEDIGRFSDNLNRPPTFRIAQGSSLTTGRSHSFSIFPAVAHSPTAIANVLPVAAGVHAPSTDQDRGVGGKSARVSSGPLSYAPNLVDEGKQLADESLQ